MSQDFFLLYIESMRSLKIAALLCILISGFAFSHESSLQPAKRPSRLFMAADLGLSYAHYGYPSKEFHGLGPMVGFKFGGSTRGQLFSFFGTAKFAGVFGSMDEVDASGYRFFLGAGTAFYPFDGGDSPMHGAFVGVAFGLMAVAADWDDVPVYIDRTLIEEQGFSFELELGKTWAISEKWRLGFAATAAVDLPIRYGEGTYECSLYSFGASLRLSRK